MSSINYPIQTSPAKTSRAGFSNRRLSWKDSIEVARFIKGMKTTKAKAFLEDVVKMKRAVPLKKFNDNRGHKPGKLGPGRYPVNVSLAFLELINSAEKNAENKGLDVKSLIVQYAFANKGASFSRPRRNSFRGQIRKSANVSIILRETGAGLPKTKAAKKAEAKQEKKVEAKTEAKVKEPAAQESVTPKKENTQKKNEKQESKK
ncbi:50S ribosomal protein L22 [uncultured archaeon]|nr:50S ribosomal protein L22 [uncultured archaeon]